MACALCALPAPAHAEGLYEPFPDAASKARAGRFIDRLASRTGSLAASELRLSSAEIERGVFLDPGLAKPAPRNVASRAAARSGFGPSFGWPAAVALLVLAPAGVTVLGRRRQAAP